MLRANRRGCVGGGAPITEETSLRIKNGFAAYGNVEHRAAPAGGPVPEVVKWLVRLEGRDVTAPLLRPLLEVGGEIPSRRAAAERGVVAYRRSEEHTSEQQVHRDLVCRLLL